MNHTLDRIDNETDINFKEEIKEYISKNNIFRIALNKVKDYNVNNTKT